jgi:acyl-CoA thioester hydrolase
LAFLVREMQLDFLRAALLDDELQVTVEVKERRAASILFAQSIYRADGVELLRATVRVACVDTRRMRPVQIPAGLIPGL